MNFENEYRKLEEGFVKYKDLCSLSTCNAETDNEPFVKLPQKQFVRKTVFDKLQRANEFIKQRNPELRLIVIEGWRSLEAQTQMFNRQLERLRPLYKDVQDLLEATHRQVAVPAVASHPTGGAVDVIIKDSRNRSLDFGTELYDFSTRKQYTFSPEINAAALSNRMLLRSAMLAQGFAPFDGEWWHFSYGDPEWAVYYGKKEYLYSQKNLSPKCG